MKKTKLLFINGHLNTGGVEKALLDILQHLDYDKYEVDLLLTEELGDYASQLPKRVNVMLRSLVGTYGSFPKVMTKCLRDRDWFSLKMRLIFLLMRYFGIGRISLAKKMLTDNQKYDCVIGFRRGICTQIAAYATNAKQCVTWWHHGAINVDIKEYQKEVRRCERIVAVSNPCRQMLVEAIPDLENKTITIHNMLDEKLIRAKAKLFDPNYEKSVFHIVSVGRLSPEKHFENTVIVAQRLKQHGVNFCWHLVGDGEQRNALRELAKKLDVADRFVFEGNQVNPHPYMYHADLFVHPSYVESFGLVVAEALTLGRACVVTKSTGVMDFLVDGENALLTEQNADDLTDKVMRVLINDDLRYNLRMHASCPKEFDHYSIINKIEEIVIGQL